MSSAIEIDPAVLRARVAELRDADLCYSLRERTDRAHRFEAERDILRERCETLAAQLARLHEQRGALTASDWEELQRYRSAEAARAAARRRCFARMQKRRDKPTAS